MTDINKQDTSIQFLYVDLFCGAGGTSTGVEMAQTKNGKCAKVIACVNHDANAIASHYANHTGTLHFTEDIRTLALGRLVEYVAIQKELYPNAKLVLWASLECTNFSKAKGGLPRDADSRTLANHLFRYIAALDPDYIKIENVEEFMSWGDLDKNGKPISKTNGKNYRQWIDRVKAHGYNYDYRILNSADYGAFTSRKRFFGTFAKYDLPIVFPKQTHAQNVDVRLDRSLRKWNAVKECLDFSDEGQSIFVRKKPLVESTLLRIHAGLVKFVAGGKDKWIIKYNSMSQSGKHNPPSVDDPCPVVSCQNRLGIVQTTFLSKYFSGEPYSKNVSIDQPAGTITTVDHHSVINTQFLQSYYGNGGVHAVSDPSPTLTTRDRLAMIDTHFVMNPQYQSAGGSINNPCFTLIARMDKMPPYLIEASSDKNSISPFVKITEDTAIYEIYADDSDAMKQIKEFMAMYGVLDIKMRMLRVSELKMIMGFPQDYVLIGTQAEQKKYIGNAVEVNVARAMCEADANELLRLNKQIA